MEPVAHVVILEATGHYHRALASYLDGSGYTYYMVNPLQSKRAKGTPLRKVKTDALDAWHQSKALFGMVTLLLTMIRQLDELEKQTGGDGGKSVRS